MRSVDDVDFSSVTSFRYSELEPYFWDSKARVAHLDRDGIIASACFPVVEFPSYAGQLFLSTDDRELALASVIAYNDFILEEWVGAAPDRYIGVVVVPLWDPGACAAEIVRTAAQGARAITFPEDPSKLGLPSIHDRVWDPMWAAAQETGLPVCLHNGSGHWMPPMSPGATLNIANAVVGVLGPMTVFDWCMGDMFVRFPSLRVVLPESNVGWIPWALWRADFFWERHSGWAGSRTPDPPSTYFHSNVYGCAFPYEDSAVAAIEGVGAGNFLIETDYPHTDMSYPNTVPLLEKTFGALPPEDYRKVLEGNARTLFRV